MRAREAELRRRFMIRQESFAQGSCRLELLMPSSPDDLLDEAEFARDERIPYWAELWPAARALARHLLAAPAPAGRGLELGCGLALPSLVLRGLGAEVLATDYYDDALEFAQVNAWRNGLGDFATALVDWRSPPVELGRFENVVAADVLYEARHIEPLAAALAQLVAPGGTALLADPDRRHLPAFVAAMRASGWTVHEVARTEDRQPGAARAVTVILLQLTR